MINKAAQGVHGLHNVALKELRGAQKEIKNISDALRALPRLDRRQRTYSKSECPCIHVLRGVCRRPLSSKRRMCDFDRILIADQYVFITTECWC